MTEPLDVEAMREAAAVLVGRHDFTSFRAAKCAAKSPVRNLVELSVVEEVRCPSTGGGGIINEQIGTHK